MELTLNGKVGSQARGVTRNTRPPLVDKETHRYRPVLDRSLGADRKVTKRLQITRVAGVSRASSVDMDCSVRR